MYYLVDLELGEWVMLDYVVVGCLMVKCGIGLLVGVGEFKGLLVFGG